MKHTAPPRPFVTLRAALLAVTLLVSSPGNPGTKPGGALFYPKGIVNLNGRRFSHMTGIFPGALVQTTEGSATIVLRGTSALIAAHSDASYNADAFDLRCGVLTLSSEAGSAVRASAVTIFPASREATKFHVGRLGGMLHIISVAGPLWINSATTNRKLPSGMALSLPDKDGCRRGS